MLFFLATFLQVACIGDAGQIRWHLVGPLDGSEVQASFMAAYLVHERGCEVGGTVTRWRWSDALPVAPMHPRYWKHLELQDWMTADLAAERLHVRWGESQP